MPHLISICLPNLNTRPFLEERMETILAQTVKDWELIICDSYSNDGSWEFLQKFKCDPRIRMYQVPREGIYAGWNECLRRAMGEYVWIATSDDGASPTFLEALLRPLERHPDLYLASCDHLQIDGNGKPLAQTVNGYEYKQAFFGELMNLPHLRDGNTEFLLHTALGTTWTTMAAILFRRRLLSKIGMFSPHTGPLADVEWSYRASLVSSNAYVPGQLVTFRIHSNQNSGHLTSADYRYLADTIKSIATDTSTGFPGSWRQTKNWQNELLKKPLWDYYDSLQLFRHLLKTSPTQFLRNAWNALRLEPDFFLHQVRHGFKWTKQFSPDPIEAANRLITGFHAPWPPPVVPNGW
jgi:glycosyltransferase involved in cell wall biosynthesis